jgi:hypothetical protein
MKLIVERRWSMRSKIGLILTAIVILIVLASRSQMGPPNCTVVPVTSFVEGGPKCG